MAIEKIQIEQFLALAKHYPVLDVRSPGEYTHAHIPGSISFPLFTDKERKLVGTTYKQKSREEAIKIGLDFFGPKMRQMVEDAERIIGNRQQPISKEELNYEMNPLPIANCLLIHCWRGGMRSAAIAWLLDLYGFKVYTLIGGYKKYRNYVLDTFRLPFQFNIVGGYTGSGKTQLLKTLQQKGETVIDLEGVANHKGSAFGNIGMPVQPGQEMFENLLSFELRKISKAPPSERFGEAWLEDESQRIGLVNIPKDLWQNMRQSPIFFLEIPFEERLKHICEEYGGLEPGKVEAAINRISQKLGNLAAKSSILLLNEGKISESFAILLKYYDKHYLKGLHNRDGLNTLLHTITCKSVTPENANFLATQTAHQPEKC